LSISSTGLYGSATIVNSNLFIDVEDLNEQVTTLSTSFLTTTQEHRDDVSQNRLDVSQNRYDFNDIINNKIPDLTADISDISDNTYACMYVCMHAHTYFVLTNPPIRPRHVMTWQKIKIFFFTS
jgi:hypothetical protein